MADSIIRLKVESSEYDSKIKRAAQGLAHMEEACRKVGGTLAILDNDEKKFVQSLGTMETVSKDARGRVNELSKAYIDLSVRFKALTQEEQKGDYGKALKKSLEEIRQRIVSAKTELKDINKELSVPSSNGGFLSSLEEIGSQLGINSDLMAFATKGTIAYTAAAAGAASAIYKAAEAWREYNREIAQQDQITSVTTGLQGSDASAMTDQVRAIAQTYDVDFRDAINAANTLMTQFGVSGQEAINLLSRGMQGMIVGDGAKLLSMIQQYAPAFRDAGIQASELIAIIHNTEGGIFTDDNMNAIVMGIKNIRLMKDATKETLRSVGIDADDMAMKLNSGAMSVFDALGVVSNRIQELGTGSQAAGELMNDIFGRQGVAAGTNLGKAIETLNLNLAETQTQTGSLGEAMRELEDVNAQLNAVMRETFSYNGWEEMEIGIRVKLRTCLINLLDVLNSIIGRVQSIYEGYQKLEDKISGNVIVTVLSKAADAGWRMVTPFAKAYEYIKAIMSMLGKTPNVKVPEVKQPAPSTSNNNQSPVTTPQTIQTPQVVSSSKSKTSKTEEELTFKKKFYTENELDRMLTQDLAKNPYISPSVEQGLAGKKVNFEELSKLMGFQYGDGQKSFSKYDFDQESERKKRTNSGSDSIEELNKLLSGINQITSGLESMGIELPSGMKDLLNGLNGLMSIIQGVQTVISIFSTTSQSANTAAIIANTASNIALTTAVAANTTALAVNTTTNFIPFFSSGGIVRAASGFVAGKSSSTTALTTNNVTNFLPFASGGIVRAASGFVAGKSYSGDNIPALLNAGEVVFNAAQTANLATKLQGNSNDRGGFSAQPYVEAEKIFLGINNYLKATGRGELITTR